MDGASFLNGPVARPESSGTVFARQFEETEGYAAGMRGQRRIPLLEARGTGAASRRFFEAPGHYLNYTDHHSADV